MVKQAVGSTSPRSDHVTPPSIELFTALSPRRIIFESQYVSVFWPGLILRYIEMRDNVSNTKLYKFSKVYYMTAQIQTAFISKS